MQVKTTDKIIRKKITEWINTITDNSLKKNLLENILVSGGCIVSLLTNKDVNDYDVYIKDMDVLIRLADYYTSSFKDQIQVLDGRMKESLISECANFHKKDIEYMHDAYTTCLRNLKDDQVKLYFTSKSGGLAVNKEIKDDEGKYIPKFFSPNAISLSDQLQIIIRFHGDAEQIHKTFDFIHATNYWTAEAGLVCNVPALLSIMTKTLKYQGSFYPVTSIIRVKKFIARQWHISAGEMMKIIMQISDYNLKDPDVLEDQLIGVDIAYFELLIDALRGISSEEKFTSAYINTIIDKIFNDSNTEDINIDE